MAGQNAAEELKGDWTYSFILLQNLRQKEGKSKGISKKKRNIRKRKDRKATKTKKSQYQVVTHDLDDPEIELNLPFMGEYQTPPKK